MKYLSLYYKWMKTGKISDTGLCYALPNGHTIMNLNFKPDGYDGLWGYDGTPYMSYNLTDELYQVIAYDFTPLRQNIVLFLAAMNGEL